MAAYVEEEKEKMTNESECRKNLLFEVGLLDSKFAKAIEDKCGNDLLQEVEGFIESKKEHLLPFPEQIPYNSGMVPHPIHQVFESWKKAYKH